METITKPNENLIPFYIRKCFARYITRDEYNQLILTGDFKIIFKDESEYIKEMGLGNKKPNS